MRGLRFETALIRAVQRAGRADCRRRAAAPSRLHVQDELLAARARLGWWTLEWWWDQPNTPHVKDWVASYQKAYNDGSYPSARTWFGYAGLHALALGVGKAKSLDPDKVAHALEGLELPPQIKLQPNKVYFRPRDHQLMSSEFPGEVLQNGTYPNLFKVADIVAGDKIALPVDQTGCKLDYSA